jgi:hypothetical protein
MSISCLLAECDAADIRLFADNEGGLIIDAPSEALTPVLLDRLKTAKLELLVLLTDGHEGDAVVDEPWDGPWATEACDLLGPDGWPVGALDPDQVPACKHCGMQAPAWQSMAGDPYGHTPGTWRCLRCDPPAVAMLFRQRSQELRNGANLI